MKKSNDIISHIKQHPQYSKLKSVECFEKFKSLLPMRYKNSILFMYIKKQTLFISLNHPALKMEFNYNLNLIKRLLKELKKEGRYCQDIEIDDIKLFVGKDLYDKKNDNSIRNESQIIYHEKSTGEFEIKTDNEKLRKIFQDIKNHIKKNIYS